MITSKLLTSAVFVASALCTTGAFASDNDYPGTLVSQSGSTTTRAQVRAEYLQAKREGTLLQADDNYPVVSADTSGKTRAEVRAELANAKRAGYSSRIDNSYPEKQADSES